MKFLNSALFLLAVATATSNAASIMATTKTEGGANDGKVVENHTQEENNHPDVNNRNLLRGPNNEGRKLYYYSSSKGSKSGKSSKSGKGKGKGKGSKSSSSYADYHHGCTKRHAPCY